MPGQPNPRSVSGDGVCRVALAGFGTVGRSATRILCSGLHPGLRLTHIFNRNVARKKQDWVPGDVIWTENFGDLLASGVDIVVELMGLSLIHI